MTHVHYVSHNFYYIDTEVLLGDDKYSYYLYLKTNVAFKAMR